MPKKDRERTILRMVYDEAEFTEIARAEDEKPDFQLHRSDSKAPFGVEVTEVYESAPLARLRRIPTYVSELLAGGRVRHKDDAANLNVHRGEITDPEGNHKQFADAIIVEKVTEAEYTQLLAAAIARKSVKLRTYDTGVSHTNLVILDTTGRWRGADKATVGWHMLSAEVLSELLRTSFREIVVVSDLGEDGWASVALKLHFLLASARFFEVAVNSIEQEITDADVWLDRFAVFLCERGALVHRFRHETHQPKLIFGNTGVGFGRAKEFIVFDLAETLTPAEAYPVKCDPQRCSAELHARFEELARTHTFTFGAVPKALRQPPD